MVRRSWWLPLRSRVRPRGPCICRRATTGTTTGPMSGCTADRPLWRMLQSIRCRCLYGVGSIVPLGSEVLNAQQPQAIASVRVYPGVDGSFTLFQEDGKTQRRGVERELALRTADRGVRVNDDKTATPSRRRNGRFSWPYCEAKFAPRAQP